MELTEAQAAKFYTVHLNRAQAEELLTIWSQHPERVQFYVTPWLPSLSDEAPPWLVG